MSLRWASRKQSIALLRNTLQRCGTGKCAARFTEWCCHLGGIWVLMAGFGMPLTHARHVVCAGLLCQQRFHLEYERRPTAR